MAKLILTIGLPGCGKSTWAQAEAERLGRVVIVERDVIRWLITGDRRDFSRELAVTDYSHAQVRAALAAGITVIVSDTNLKPRYRREFERIAALYEAEVEIKSFLGVPIELCIARDAVRPDPVGEDVIRGMHKYLLDSGQITE